MATSQALFIETLYRVNQSSDFDASAANKAAGVSIQHV